MSGAPEDSNANLPPSGISRGDSAIIHRTPDSVRCAKEERPQELASFGNLQRLVRYNSPDMSGVYRTVRCNSGATASRRQRLPAAQLMRALRAQKSGAPILAHRTRNSACPVCTGHPGGPTSQKLQRSESNGSDDVAGAPDMSGVHRTVRCNSGATAFSAPTATYGALNARAARAEVRRAHTGTPDSKQYLSGVHRTSRRAHKSEAPTVRIQRQ